MEKFFWADAIADNIVKKVGKKKGYVCASGITPSGEVHIGNFREVITTDMVVRALREKGHKVRFIYSWDDYDRFRKVPAGVDKKFEKYIGMPLSDVPSPDSSEKRLSYAEHFEKRFEQGLEKVGIKPEFIRQNIMNKKCTYADLIKTAIEKRDTIMKILNKYRKEPLSKDWYPVSIYCEKCKKDFGKVVAVDGYEIEYECKCGFKNKIDFRKKGIVKAAWRVDWPMRWKFEEVVFEPGGIDHSVSGGSFDTGKQIAKEVFNYPAPMYQMYEWIGVKGGGAFSSSTGNVLTLNDVEEVYEPEVLRYLFVGTRPSRAFDISFDLDVIKIYEDYDKLEEKYYSGEANPMEKRQYEVCQLKLSKKQPKRIGFRHLVTLVQVNETQGLDKAGKIRAAKVRNWLEKYAPEEMKFEFQKKIPGSARLNKKEKEALKELKKSLKKKDYGEKELFNEFYEICKRIEIKNTEFFDAAYRVIINKRKGPRLASLILAVGKENIIKLLNQIK